MATIVSRLPAALLKCNKLIAQVDEGHGVTLASQPAVETPKLFNEHIGQPVRVGWLVAGFPDVRFWHKADMAARLSDVRFRR